jgi:hypothetical protein
MARVPSYVQVAPDSTGKLISNSQLVDANSNTVQRQVVSLGDSATEPNIVAVTGAGSLQVDARVPQTPGSPTSATVGTSSASILAANSSRTGAVIINLSTNTVSLGFGVAAVLGSGITLTQSGSFTMDAFCFSKGAVNAIASAAGSAVSIQEYS